MNNYITGTLIKKLREDRRMTQEQLADKVYVTAKAISKWETGKGFPDIGLVEPLAKALGISVIELLSGEDIRNRNRSADMRKVTFYICPVCGNIIQTTGEAVVSCCGITLPPLEAEPCITEPCMTEPCMTEPCMAEPCMTEPNMEEHCADESVGTDSGTESDDEHRMNIEVVEDEYYVTLDHPMTKTHYISFMAAVSDRGVQLVKLYPEEGAEARFKLDRVERIYACCNRHGLFRLDLGRGKGHRF